VLDCWQRRRLSGVAEGEIVGAVGCILEQQVDAVKFE